MNRSLFEILHGPPSAELQPPSKAPPLPKIDPSRRVILVAVDLQSGSVSALETANELAKSRGLAVRLLHAVAEPLEAEFWHPQDEAPPPLDRARFLQEISESVQRWAMCEAGVKVSATAVRVRFGPLYPFILAEAAQSDVEMVVLARTREETTSPRRAMLHELVRSIPKPLLVAGPRGQQPVVVAATDCSDPALPVFHQAWRMAAALGKRLALVHNVDPQAAQFAQRIGASRSSRLAQILSLRSKEWLEEVAEAADIIITHHQDNAQGVLGAARGLGADLLVIGVKAAPQAPRKTADQILDERHSSVLFVPLSKA